MIDTPSSGAIPNARITTMSAVMHRSTVLALALSALSGCASLREMFPSRDEVFKPIPVTIGDPRIIGDDTIYVLETPEYELLAPIRDLLPDARKALDHTAR